MKPRCDCVPFYFQCRRMLLNEMWYVWKRWRIQLRNNCKIFATHLLESNSFLLLHPKYPLCRALILPILALWGGKVVEFDFLFISFFSANDFFPSFLSHLFFSRYRKIIASGVYRDYGLLIPPLAKVLAIKGSEDFHVNPAYHIKYSIKQPVPKHPNPSKDIIVQY